MGVLFPFEFLFYAARNSISIHKIRVYQGLYIDRAIIYRYNKKWGYGIFEKINSSYFYNHIFFSWTRQIIFFFLYLYESTCLCGNPEPVYFFELFHIVCSLYVRKLENNSRGYKNDFFIKKMDKTIFAVL